MNSYKNTTTTTVPIMTKYEVVRGNNFIIKNTRGTPRFSDCIDREVRDMNKSLKKFEFVYDATTVP